MVSDNQVVELSQNERRQEKWPAVSSEDRGAIRVTMLARVDSSEQPARVEDQHLAFPETLQRLVDALREVRYAASKERHLRKGWDGAGRGAPDRVAAATRFSAAFSDVGRYTVVFLMPYIIPYVGVDRGSTAPRRWSSVASGRGRFVFVTAGGASSRTVGSLPYDTIWLPI